MKLLTFVNLPCTHPQSSKTLLRSFRVAEKVYYMPITFFLRLVNFYHFPLLDLLGTLLSTALS